MFNRKKAGMMGAIGLSAAIITGIAVSAFADTKVPQSDVSKGEAVQNAPMNSAPTHEQLASRMAQQLGLDEKTQSKVSDLFEKDGKAIREIQDELHTTQVELSGLSPSSKNYMDKVEDLAEESGELTKELTVAFAKNRAGLYELLTPEQIQKLETPVQPQS
ncbi:MULTISPECIES: Spy/CpxP family protein refolding chaperone [Marinomonas]|uniref:Spy/CpxP family protein refolding chaperone n=1 Tax=Marinomonas alcarazii TaxID=491949 RepID=A0A318V643_9GAMM|nr:MULTISPECIES: Spy/CpxP family protein refolding chaperone [Marinomonas]PYF82958.1 Spy/CpxP family protein refolding chaperone [Marinomonas alcarazii]